MCPEQHDAQFSISSSTLFCVVAELHFFFYLAVLPPEFISRCNMHHDGNPAKSAITRSNN